MFNSWVILQTPHEHLSGSGCPYCVRNRVHKTTCLAALYPNLVKEWSPNNKLSPFDVSTYSKQYVDWICSSGHTYNMAIYYRIRKGLEFPGKECPHCFGFFTKENCLESKYPEIASDWDYLKNSMTPRNVSYSSNKKVYWICKKCRCSYETKVCHRTLNKTACPKCKYKNQQIVNDLLINNFPHFIIKSQKIIYRYINGKIVRRQCDFWMYDLMLTIMVEYDGMQHFKPVEIFGGKEGFIKQRLVDVADVDYCRENSVILFRIKYNDDKETKINELKSLIEEKRAESIMSYDQKISDAAVCIEKYNANVEIEKKIDIESFKKKIRKMGGITEELLAFSSFEDLEQAGLPQILAKNIAAIFRNRNPMYISDKQAARMDNLQLIQHYNPKDSNSAIAKRLKEISKDKKFIIYVDGVVDIKESNKLLQELIDGFEPREIINIDGKPTKPYKIGEKPGRYFDENPLYPGRPLRSDGTCDQINRSWNNIPLTIRQLYYLAITKTNEINLNSEKAHELMDMAEKAASSGNCIDTSTDPTIKADDGTSVVANVDDVAYGTSSTGRGIKFKWTGNSWIATNQGADTRSIYAEKYIRQRYPQASIMLDKLIQTSTAPTLKIELGDSASKLQDPFFSQHKQY